MLLAARNRHTTAEGTAIDHTHAFMKVILPPGVMLARYMLLRVSVRQSLCHKPVLYRNDCMNRAGFWREFHLSNNVF